jgi:hypothetical protein
MKPDLERANEALAGDRSEEASVYAWNALADLGPDDAPELGPRVRRCPAFSDSNSAHDHSPLVAWARGASFRRK